MHFRYCAEKLFFDLSIVLLCFTYCTTTIGYGAAFLHQYCTRSTLGSIALTCQRFCCVIVCQHRNSRKKRLYLVNNFLMLRTPIAILHVVAPAVGQA